MIDKIVRCALFVNDWFVHVRLQAVCKDAKRAILVFSCGHITVIKTLCEWELIL